MPAGMAVRRALFATPGQWRQRITTAAAVCTLVMLLVALRRLEESHVREMMQLPEGQAGFSGGNAEGQPDDKQAPVAAGDQGGRSSRQQQQQQPAPVEFTAPELYIPLG